MYALGSAGFSTEQVIDSMAGVMNLAGATMSDLGSAAQSTVSTLAQFGLGAKDSERVANVFAASIKNSQLTLERLSSGMTYAGAVSSGFGNSLEETTAALALMNNAGIQGAMAGTALRGALVRLATPTRQAAEVLEGYGLALEDVNPATHSLSEIIGVLERAGLTAADSMTIFGQRAGPGMMTLLKAGQGALDGMTESITGTNAAAEMMAIQTDTVQGKWKLFKSAIQEVWLELFEHLSPAIKQVIDWGTEMIRKLGDWINTTDGLVSWGAVITTALTTVGGAILSLIGFFPVFSATLFAFLPVALAIAGALSFLGLGLVKLIEGFKDFSIEWGSTAGEIWEVFQENFIKIYDLASEWWDEQVPKIIDAVIWLRDKWEEHSGEILDYIEGWWESINGFIDTYFTGSNGYLTAISDALDEFAEGDWVDGWKIIKAKLMEAWEDIKMRSKSGGKKSLYLLSRFG